jgi:hypothetical protein
MPSRPAPARPAAPWNLTVAFSGIASESSSFKYRRTISTDPVNPIPRISSTSRTALRPVFPYRSFRYALYSSCLKTRSYRPSKGPASRRIFLTIARSSADLPDRMPLPLQILDLHPLLHSEHLLITSRSGKLSEMRFQGGQK